MRILYFSQSYTTHDYRFLDAIERSGRETYFLCLEPWCGIQDRRILPNGVNPLGWSRAHLWPNDPTAAIEEFAHIFEEVRPDIVHAGPVPDCAFIAAMAKARPLLAASWGSDLLVEADLTQLAHDRTCFALRNSDKLLADCNEVVGKARALTGYPSDRIVQLPWGVDLDQFKPGFDDAGLRSQFDSGSFILLSARKWEPTYGILHLLRGFLEAHKALPRLCLLLVNTGSLSAQVEAFVQENHLSKFVRMPGQIPTPQLPRYYRAADLYVSCALSDGSSISLLEAMASGLPVIATDRASNREWVDDGSGGLLVKFGDSMAIRDAILRIESMSIQERNTWGNVNLAIAHERADWRKNSQKLLAAYEDLRTSNSGLP
jgi:L-malate glycosyltransferase